MVCYIRDNIKYSDCKYRYLNKSCKDLEMLWVGLELNQMRPVVVVSIYRPLKEITKTAVH